MIIVTQWAVLRTNIKTKCGAMLIQMVDTKVEVLFSLHSPPARHSNEHCLVLEQETLLTPRGWNYDFLFYFVFFFEGGCTVVFFSNFFFVVVCFLLLTNEPEILMDSLLSLHPYF